MPSPETTPAIETADFAPAIEEVSPLAYAGIREVIRVPTHDVPEVNRRLRNGWTLLSVEVERWWQRRPGQTKAAVGYVRSSVIALLGR